MSIPGRVPRGRHRRSSPGAPGRARLSPSTWRGIQRSLTAGLFLVATVTGVTVGLGGAAVSPVAPGTAAAATAAPPLALAMPAHGPVHGHHR